MHRLKYAEAWIPVLDMAHFINYNKFMEFVKGCEAAMKGKELDQPASYIPKTSPWIVNFTPILDSVVQIKAPDPWTFRCIFQAKFWGFHWRSHHWFSRFVSLVTLV